MYGRECPYCGDGLDPGEKCQCREARRARGEIKEPKPKKQSAAAGKPA